jgi:acetylornithine deacetylase
VKVHGTQMHSSIADLVPSVNANVKMAEVLTRLARELRFTYQPHPLCPQGVTMGPGVMVSGGVSYGVLPGYAEFATEVRLLPGMTVEGVKRDVQQFLSEVCADDPDLDVEVEFEHGPLRYIAPVVVSEEHPFVRRLQAAAEQILGQCPPQGAFPAWTDARFFDAISGIRTIPAFGPGLLVVTHAPNEHVRVESIVEACKIYALAAASYLTGERETIGSRRRTKRGGALGD